MSRVYSPPTARWKGYYYKWKAAVVNARRLCCVPDSEVQMWAGYPWDRTGFSSRSRREPITVFSVFMISWAVEPSFSSTVTSINDPLCTVLAANLKEKKEKRETFYHEGKKGDSIHSNRFKITRFFLNNLLQVPYCQKPKAKHSSEKSINCPAPCLPQAGNFSVSLEQNRKRSSILLTSLNNRCMWIILCYYIFGNHLFIWYLTFHHA